MDPFTEKLLERTRQRREQLQQKLQRTPSTADDRKQGCHLRESPINLQGTAGSGDADEHKPRTMEAASCVKPDTPAIPGIKQRVTILSQQDKENAQVDNAQQRNEHGPTFRQGRFAELAQQINDWEDDLHHVSARKPDPKKKVCQVKNVQMPENPPKPPRAFQQAALDMPEKAALSTGSDADSVTSNSNVPQSLSDGDDRQTSAFAFASPMQATDSVPLVNSLGLARRPLRPANDPASASVADRFAAWEQRTAQAPGDAGNNSCLRRDGPATRARTKSANVALWEDKLQGPMGSAPVLCLPPPCPLPADPAPRVSTTQRRRSRSHTDAPWAANANAFSSSADSATSCNTKLDVTARRPLGTPSSAARNVSTPVCANGGAALRSTAGSHRKDESEDEWHKAPMSARKNAWEQKIAEHQNIAEEHSRLMYRQLSGSNLQEAGQAQATNNHAPAASGSSRPGEVTSAKKLVERPLSQSKEYDPSAKAKSEREAELRALNDRYKNGILKYDGGQCGQPNTSDGIADCHSQHPTAAPRRASNVPSNATTAATISGSSSSTLTAVKRGFEDALVGDGYEVEKSSIANSKGMRVAKVSFKEESKPAVGTRRRSSSPIDNQPRRRSSCKIPKLGYDSSDSSDVDETMTPAVPKNYAASPAATPNFSSTKIPSIGYDSSTADEMSSHDITEEDTSAVSSTTVSPTSTESDSYHVETEINDLLDDALASDEDRQSAAPFMHATTPVVSQYVKPRYSPCEEPAVTPVVYSIDAYRSMRKKAEHKAAAKNISIKPPAGHVGTSLSAEPATLAFTKQDVVARIKELHELAQHEQNVITQTSNALNQCSGNSQFAGSSEQIECNRLLLIACQRRQAYLGEIERIKCLPPNGHLYPPTGKGSLTICDIQLPLKKESVQRMMTGEDTSVYYFVLMVRSGPQIVVTQMVSTLDALAGGVLHIPNMIKLNDIMNDFKYELEIYSMHVSHDSLKTPRKDKKKLNKSKSTSGTQGQSGTLPMRATSFTHITSLSITMASINKTAFALPRVPFLSPLQGVMSMRLTCLMECNVTANGFLNMFEDVAGFGAWHRRWFVLNNNRLSYWKYPDDEKIREPVGFIDLKQCVTETIQLVSRDKCARPNTLELVLHQPKPSTGKDSVASRPRERGTEDICWLSADTKDDRILWAKKLNEAVTNIRLWYSEAPQPVRQQKQRI